MNRPPKIGELADFDDFLGMNRNDVGHKERKETQSDVDGETKAPEKVVRPPTLLYNKRTSFVQVFGATANGRHSTPMMRGAGDPEGGATLHWHGL